MMGYGTADFGDMDLEDEPAPRCEFEWEWTNPRNSGSGCPSERVRCYREHGHAGRHLGPLGQRPKYETVECCATCEQPKSRTNEAGDERERGWPVCINPDCVALGEGVASASYRQHLVQP